jgi:hypothetical protein
LAVSNAVIIKLKPRASEDFSVPRGSERDKALSATFISYFPRRVANVI